MQDATTSDAQLVRQARNGCPRAARALYQRHEARVFTVLVRMLRREELARDLAQETWIRAFGALSRFRQEARFSTWIHRIALNTALSEIRRMKKREGRETELCETLPSSRTARDPLLAERIGDALERLPDGMREILVLHDIEGCTHKEIAESLGISVGTSKSQLFRARGKMRDMLEDVAEPYGLETAEAA